MERCFFDLCVGADGLGERISVAEQLGWSGVCFVKLFDSDYKSFVSCVGEAKKKTKIEVLCGALINPKKAEDVAKLARGAVEVADLVLVYGGDEEINRAASECWELDILLHPERVEGKDLMDQRNSGLDDVTAKFMAERGIAVGIDFSSLLNSFGFMRSQQIARVKQNILLADKYGAPVVFCSAANDVFGMRAPRDMLSVLLSFGVEAGYAKKIMLEYPGMLVKKSADRRNPNIILKGLEVTEWCGGRKTDRKRMHGWY